MAASKGSVMLPKRRARYLELRFVSQRGLGIVFVGGKLMLLLSNAQKVTASCEPTDQYGNPARIDGIPTWNNSDPTIVQLDVAANGLTAVVTALGPLGTAQISATVDADLGAGVRTISQTADIQVEASEAVSLAIKFGAPEPK